MKSYALMLVSILSASASAQEPPFSYGEFWYQPAGWTEGELSEKQKNDLDGCVAEASRQAGVSKKDREQMNSLYGVKVGTADFYGAILNGCLAEEKGGKGWLVLRRSGEAWEPVSSRYATRSFMGIDPSK